MTSLFIRIERVNNRLRLTLPINDINYKVNDICEVKPLINRTFNTYKYNTTKKICSYCQTIMYKENNYFICYNPLCSHYEELIKEI